MFGDRRLLRRFRKPPAKQDETTRMFCIGREERSETTRSAVVNGIRVQGQINQVWEDASETQMRPCLLRSGSSVGMASPHSHRLRNGYSLRMWRQNIQKTSRRVGCERRRNDRIGRRKHRLKEFFICYCYEIQEIVQISLGKETERREKKQESGPWGKSCGGQEMQRRLRN